MAAFEGGRAFEVVKTLSGGTYEGRRATSPGHDRARRWIATRLESWGYEVRRHPFRYPISIVEVVGSPTGSLLTSKERRLPLSYRSDFAEHPASAQNRRRLKGPVTRWDHGSQLRDRWVILARGPEALPLHRQVEEAATRGALGFLIPFAVPQDGVIFKQLPAGTPYPLPTFFVRRELLDADLPKEVDLNVGVRRVRLTGTNLMVEIAGSNPTLAHQPILLGAHYDAVGDDSDGRRFPGASDNASGVAVVLEIARVLRARRTPLPRPVWIAAFDAEETGAYGAHALAAEFRHSGISPLVINIDLSALGDHPVAVEGSSNSVRLLEALDAAGKRTGVPLAHGAISSDNRQFAAVGFPSVGLGSGGLGYHTPADGPERVEISALERSGNLILAALEELAG